jgi:hypothetical protein
VLTSIQGQVEGPDPRQEQAPFTCPLTVLVSARVGHRCQPVTPALATRHRLTNRSGRTPPSCLGACERNLPQRAASILISGFQWEARTKGIPGIRGDRLRVRQWPRLPALWHPPGHVGYERSEKLMVDRQGISEREQQLLVEALGALGGRGASAVARRLRCDIFEGSVSVPLSLERARELVWKILADCGRLIDSDASAAGDEAGRVQAIVGAGHWNLNPAVVTVVLGGGGPALTEVRVRGVAKEGLLKQRAGEGAARRILELLAGEAGA